MLGFNIRFSKINRIFQLLQFRNDRNENTKDWFLTYI